MAQYIATMIDNSGERSSVTIPTDDLEGIDTFNVASVDSLALQGNLEAISLLAFDTVTFTQRTVDEGATIPDVPYANREAGLRIFMKGDDSGKSYSITVPGPNEAAVERLPGTDLADLTAEPLATFVTWLEANYLAAYGAGSEGVTVERAVFVGRNN